MSDTAFSRVNLTLRPEDAEYLRLVAFKVFQEGGEKRVAERLRRGERMSASMAVRFLIDEHRKAKRQ